MLQRAPCSFANLLWRHFSGLCPGMTQPTVFPTPIHDLRASTDPAAILLLRPCSPSRSLLRPLPSARTPRYTSLSGGTRYFSFSCILSRPSLWVLLGRDIIVEARAAIASPFFPVEEMANRIGESRGIHIGIRNNFPTLPVRSIGMTSTARRIGLSSLCGCSRIKGRRC